MKRPTPASLKKVTTDNLARLGAARLAEILLAVAEARPEVKRRLRMELAAEQGAEHLVVEVDKRLASLQASRARVSWRQRATFLRDLNALRLLIGERLAGLDPVAALERLWAFLATARQVGARLRDREGELAAIYGRAADHLAALAVAAGPDAVADRLAEAVIAQPAAWAAWLPGVLAALSPAVAARALAQVQASPAAVPGKQSRLRELADAAGDIDAYRATFSAEAQRAPAVAADLATRLVAAGRLDEAEALLAAARRKRLGGKPVPLDDGDDSDDFAWESAHIAWLEAAGQAGAAQAARWASFERTLSVARARDIIARLPDFEDVEAEARAFDLVASQPDAARALRFLMAWPALREAAALIEARAGDLAPGAEDAEAWAARLQARYPKAAETLLRRAAAHAFRRRDLSLAEKLTREADAIAPAG